MGLWVDKPNLYNSFKMWNVFSAVLSTGCALYIKLNNNNQIDAF